MILYLFLFIFILLIIEFFVSRKLHVDLKSFFKRGFSKNDDAFGLYTYTGKQGEGKTLSAVKFVISQKKKNNYIVLTNIKSFNAFTDTIYFDNILDLISFVKEHTKEHDARCKYLVFFDEIFTVLMKRLWV